MLLKVPFYKNTEDSNRCMQVAMQAVLNYFLNKEFNVKQLDELTGRKGHYWTWTSQIVPVLYDAGLEVKYYSKIDLEPFLKGEPFIKKYFGKDADKILSYTDTSVFVKSIKKLMKYDIFEKKKLSWKKIESHIKQGHIPLTLIDANIVYGRKGFYQGHFVVVTGFDNKHVYFHESGPQNAEANKKVLKEVFIQAWNANGTDNDVVMVFGRRG